jgi:predicted kinase
MPPALVVVFGLIAAGKTTLARSLSEQLGWVAIHSDWVRKALAGIPPTQRVAVPFGQGLYAPGMSGRTYDEMFRQAREHLQAGRGVILDGSFMRAVDRQRAREVAQDCGVPIFFILCVCSPEETGRRLAQRAANQQAVSDGREAILAEQQARFEPITDLAGVPVLTVATHRPAAVVVAEVLAFLQTSQPAKE